MLIFQCLDLFIFECMMSDTFMAVGTFMTSRQHTESGYPADRVLAEEKENPLLSQIPNTKENLKHTHSTV